ncbi:Uncharacterised protein [Mycobacteroides abscessus subsp. abscessus]|nr:Uncharacterised protein [Mycobacteroides abscessus subsp. abscessus]
MPRTSAYQSAAAATSSAVRTIVVRPVRVLMSFSLIGVVSTRVWGHRR